MARTDIPSKRLIQLRPDDWAKLALNDNSDITLTEMKPDKNPKVESRLDVLYWVDNDKDSFILNIEPQGYYEAALPARMLRYRSDVWEYTMSTGRGVPSIRQVVVFFYPKDDNKEHELIDSESETSNISFKYDVIRIWELKKDYVIDNKLIGLYSLLPLMEKEPNETDEEILEKSVRSIETIENEAFKKDAFAAMSIMSEDRYSSELIKKYVRREMFMNSPLYKEWTEAEREEGRLEGSINMARDMVIDLLELKFRFIPTHIIKDIQKIENQSVLKGLNKSMLTISTIDEFEELLEKVKELD